MIDGPDEFADALILIVDDEATQRLLTRETLEQRASRLKKRQMARRGIIGSVRGGPI